MAVELARVGVHSKDAVIVCEQRAICTEVHPVWLNADAVHYFGFLGRSYVASIRASIISVPKRNLPSGPTLTLISLTSPLVVAIRYSERGFLGDFLRFMTCHRAIGSPWSVIPLRTSTTGTGGIGPPR